MIDCQGQLTLDFSPGYRKGQKTSQIADTEANSKFKARHTQLVYMAVRNHCNGGTAREIAKAGNLPHRIIWRRLHDLRDNEYLINGKPRKCKISGRLCKTWWLI
jgi:DNA invertase Pin-like site-specific DNA recombinase